MFRQIWRCATFLSLPLRSQITVPCCILALHPCPNCKRSWPLIYLYVLVFKIKKKKTFKSIDLIFLCWITFLSSIRTDILGIPHFSWVWFLFPLSNWQFQFFYLEYLSISCKYYSCIRLYHFLLIISFWLWQWPECIIWTAFHGRKHKTKHF